MMRGLRFLFLILLPLLALPACGAPSADSTPDNTASETTVSRSQTARQTTSQQPLETAVEESTAASVEETTSQKNQPGEEAGSRDKSKAKPGKARGEQKGHGGEVVTVKTKGLKYIPRQVVISPGTTVVWVNEDSAEHSVTSDDSGGPLQSGVFGQGGTFKHKFRESGIFDYYCTVHPFMTGSVRVK